MKIIKITESQYKRLVRSKKLISEQVVFKDPKDEMDAHSKMFRILDSVGYGLKTIFNKPLYVLKIEEGVAYIDKSEYQQNEISYIKTEFEKLVRSGISSYDKMLTGSDDLGFDSGHNADYVWPEVEDVDDTEDDVADVDDTEDDVADVDDTGEESECECINTDTNQVYVYDCDDNPPIECFVTDTDDDEGSDTINSVTDDCENCMNNLTQVQKNNYVSNINGNNVNDFRWWVNQDSNRLKQVTDKFEECCETKDDPTLNIVGGNNEWVEIAFSVVGNEWINSDKPERPKTVYTSKNGNLDLNDLTKIMNDVSGNDEYLSKEAAIQFNKMVVDALKDGITIKITDAYRPCGEPGDYERYLNKEIRFTQWAAWEQYKYNPKKAAAIYTPKGKKCKSKRVWDKNGGGYCTSNHGLGNAIDVAGDIKGKANQWIEENGEKYGWCKVEAKHSEGWHFTYCGSDAIDKSGHCSKCKKTKNK